MAVETLELPSWLPEGGENLFQSIKAVRTAAQERGIKILDLSIGQPKGPALESARKGASLAVLSGQESMHEYQDNGSPGVPDFERRFLQPYVEPDLTKTEHLDFLPIPGIKPMLPLIPLACGCHIKDITIATMTNPGYPIPLVWGKDYLKQNVVELPLNPQNSFRFSVKDIPKDTKLIMMNYPHNPSGQVANYSFLKELGDHCAEKGIRLFNDGPYIPLNYNSESCPLTNVASLNKNLSWAEALSASKIIGNGTGWRVGAIIGSKDFVKNIKTIKGNTDSGFAAPMAAGVLDAIENDEEGIINNKEDYIRRSALLIGLLKRHGMKLAIEPLAGFFTLWLAPSRAFGKKIESAKHFNWEMIEQTGVIGVHFNPYIRYAVTGNVEQMEEGINLAFKKAAVSYDSK